MKLSAAEITLEKARTANCVAISQALKLLKNSSAYTAASKNDKLKMEEEKKTEVVNRR